MIEKRHRRGTHRAVPPAETVRRLLPRLREFGITRVADVTGLDRIGLPVVMVVRPRSRSNAVSQGKGLDPAAARASGLMEAIETWHAERVRVEIEATPSDLRRAGEAIDVRRLPPRRDRPFDPSLRIPWVRGIDLGPAARAVWIPFELVHTDYDTRHPAEACRFCASTNGLASGNTRTEALVHALCELVERDALAIWHAAGASRRAESRLDPASIDDPDCREVLARLAAADVAVAIHDATSDVGLAVFHVEIQERGERKPPFFPRPVAGSGCHPVCAIALLRALTEAVQSRLTYIRGSRDDLREEDYDLDRRQFARARARILSDAGRCDFRTMPSFDGRTLEDDLDHVLDRLVAAGFPEIATVDLSHPGNDRIAVVRAVVPGLATLADHPHAARSPRLRHADVRQLALLAEPMM